MRLRTPLAIRTLSIGGSLAMGVVLTGLDATRASAWPISAGAGGDYYADSNRGATRSMLGYAATGGLGADVFLAALRWDDDHLGRGFGGSAGFGVPIAPLLQLRCTGTRFTGDDAYRAWRFKTGPLFSAPTGQSFGLYYQRDDGNAGVDTDGILAEAGIPLVAKLKARGNAGYLMAGERHSVQGSIGAIWSLLPHVDLSGDVGFNQDTRVGSFHSPPASRLGLADSGLPLLGGGSSDPGSTETDTPTSALTTLLGLRVTFP